MLVKKIVYIFFSYNSTTKKKKQENACKNY